MCRKIGNIFVLGSGFSASCGLPTQAGLFKALINQADPKDVPRLRNMLKLFFPHIDETADSYPPFEQFLSLLTASLDLSSDEEGSLAMFPREQQEKVRQYCLRQLRMVLVDRSESYRKNESAIQKFVRCLKTGDTIITFNWDVLIEQALRHAKKNFGFFSHADITLLKLHGSLGWYLLKDIDRDKLLEFDKFDETLGALKPEHLNSLLDVPSLPYIVTPEHQKRPSERRAMRPIWEQAYDRLGRAAREEGSKVVVVGYSLPPEDFDARLLMRMGIGACGDDKKMLHIIDPDTEVKARYSSCITSNIKFYQGRFTGDELPKILAEDS